MSDEIIKLGLAGLACGETRSFDERDDVLPDLLLVDFVENFVAHIGIKFTRDVMIAAQTKKVDGFLKIFGTDDARVIGASDKKNRQLWMVKLPARFAVSLIDEGEESLETIERKSETIARVGVIGSNYGRVADNPGIGAGGVGEFFVVAAKSEMID